MFASSAHGEGETSVDEKLAIDAFHQGDVAFDGGDFAVALEAYRRSLALLPSPNSRLLVARCLARLKRPSEALAEYEVTRNEAGQRAERDPRFIRTRDAAAEEAASMKDLVGYVDVVGARLPADAVVSLGEHVMVPASYDTKIPHDPGDVHVVIRARGYVPYEEDITLDAQKVVVLPSAPLRVARVASRKSALSIVGWTTLGVGAATLATSAILAGVTQSRYDSLVMTCAARPCSDTDLSGGRALSTATYVTLGVGLGLVALGFVAVIVSPNRRLPLVAFTGMPF